MSKRGFTILELLVVITIIGLLASIVIMATQDARKKGEYNHILQQLEQIDIALKLYISDHYPDTWPTAVSDCFRIEHMVSGNYTPVHSHGCNNATVYNRFVNFSDYMKGEPFHPGSDVYYIYYTPSLSGGRDSATEVCPDPNDPAPNTTSTPDPSGGIMITVIDDSNSANYIPPLFDYIDNAIDGGDESNRYRCGKIRMRQTADPEIYWILAEDENDIAF